MIRSLTDPRILSRERTEALECLVEGRAQTLERVATGRGEISPVILPFPAPKCAVAPTVAREICLGDEFGEGVVSANGIRVAIHADGSLDVYTDRPLVLHGAAKGDPGLQAQRELVVGERMLDGTIYAGLSPDTGEAMYTTPADAPFRTRWNEAMKYASAHDAHGHKDWRVPTGKELNVLFNNRAAIGRFNNTGSYPDSWYWSGTTIPDAAAFAWVKSFADGTRRCYHKDDHSSLRLVRG